MAETQSFSDRGLVEAKRIKVVKKMRMDTLLAGGIAGAAARTITAPLDRVKILMQTQRITAKLQNGVAADKYTSLVQALFRVAREEGFKGYWRGNLANCIRVVPYSATQFVTFEHLKYNEFASSLHPIVQRLTFGALAGMAATFVTHPLDVVRLRLAVEPELRGIVDSFRSLWKEGKVAAFYKGLGPTLTSLAPFVAINFATYDSLKTRFTPAGGGRPDPLLSLSLGAAAGIVAQTACYPLDTIRRRMQMRGRHYSSTAQALGSIVRTEGVRALYQGISANTLKVVPNNAIRFMVFEQMKHALGLVGADGGGGGG